MIPARAEALRGRSPLVIPAPKERPLHARGGPRRVRPAEGCARRSKARRSARRALRNGRGLRRFATQAASRPVAPAGRRKAAAVCRHMSRHRQVAAEPSTVLAAMAGLGVSLEGFWESNRTNSFYCSWVAAAVLARRAEHMLRLLGVGGNKKEATQDGTTDPANEASEPPAAAAAVGQTPAAVEPALPSKAPGLADVRTEPGHAARQRLVDRIEALVHADLVPPLLPVTKPELLPSKATLGLAFAWKDTDYIITRVLIGGVKGWGHQFSINMHACMPAYVHTCVVSGGPRPTDCH